MQVTRCKNSIWYRVSSEEKKKKEKKYKKKKGIGKQYRLYSYPGIRLLDKWLRIY